MRRDYQRNVSDNHSAYAALISNISGRDRAKDVEQFDDVLMTFINWRNKFETRFGKTRDEENMLAVKKCTHTHLLHAHFPGVHTLRVHFAHSHACHTHAWLKSVCSAHVVISLSSHLVPSHVSPVLAPCCSLTVTSRPRRPH